MLPSCHLVDPAHLYNNPFLPLLKVIFNVFVIIVVSGSRFRSGVHFKMKAESAVIHAADSSAWSTKG